MIDIKNFETVLKQLEFKQNKKIYSKKFVNGAILKVDFKNKKLIFPKEIKKGDETTTNFHHSENFVVFECVHNLLKKGYKAEHLELEQRYGKIKKEDGGGKADVVVKDNNNKVLLIIECKTFGKEFDLHWKKTELDGDQLFRYLTNKRETQFLCLYASGFIDNKIISRYNLITLKDNDSYLKENEGKELLSFFDAKQKNKEDIFLAWKQTYAQDFATMGIFEEDIPAYNIGKTKYSIKDLSTISSNDIQGKYHQFATILRQHNVSGRENAFDKLVNLFLCKIVDETNNPDELKFYWKGINYDNFFELQDRLQKLYQEGMKRFLGEDVTYIDNEAIDQAFRFFKNDPDATKETIKKYFRELKFFTNNDFAFIDVHNEKLFYQNAGVLLKIVKMLQDIKLKDTDEEHQFLGDMFEGFLDQGVKQSEGQFFTPMPIVKFILKSLPLESIIKGNENIPKVIDYACGAGHFLNEYAHEIKPIVKQYKETEIEKYYESIVGIEKEYRLSKVAKVSSFMYGQDDINIVYGDALAEIPKINDNEYSVLVANPPYSVKGYLETLSEIDRKKYNLTNTISEKSYPNNNSIEAFFIEKAKQLLKPGGVAGIIYPLPNLTKGSAKSTSKTTNVYVSAREILLKYFDIIAIAEFGSGTFGKTGTNTATLFIRRKNENPAPAEHYKNRINDWFKGDKTKEGVFKDEHLIRKYCDLQEIGFADYQTLLLNKPNNSLLETELFIEYRKAFDKWSDIINLKKSFSKKIRGLSAKTEIEIKRILKGSKKARTQVQIKAIVKRIIPKRKKSLLAEQELEIQKRFLSYIVEAEKDKIYYFVLASLNPQKVLVLKSPTTTSKIKEFLGYDWSTKKGNEGIKYLGGIKLEDLIEEDKDDEGNVTLEEEDKRVLNNLFNLNNIETPLYDPNDKNNKGKINYLISQNFKGENFEIPIELEEHLSKVSLEKMLDFSRPDFNKSISLIGEKLYTEYVFDKHPYNRIENLMKDVIGNKTKIDKTEIKSKGKYPVITQESNKLISGYSDNPEPISDFPLIVFGDHSFTFKLIDFDFIRGADGTQLMKFENDLLTKYVFHYTNLMRVNSPKYERHYKYLKQYKIPVPSPKIQSKIVVECDQLDLEFKKAQKIIEKESTSRNELYHKIYNSDLPLKTIEQISIDTDYGINEGMNTKNIGYKIFRMNEIINGYMYDNGEMKHVDITKEEFKKYKLESGDILFNRTNSIEHVGKTGLFNLKGEYCFASYLIRIKINVKKAYPEYVNHIMNSNNFQTFAKSKASKSINQANINATKMKAIKIPVPDDLNTQKAYNKEFKIYEAKINKAQSIIDGIKKNKEEIIIKYLQK